MNRNNASELRKEYMSALSKLQAVQAHIRTRAFDLVKEYPDVIIGDQTAQEVFETMVLYLDTNDTPDDMFVMNKFTLIIAVIEKHIAGLHPHVQQDLPFEEEPHCNCNGGGTYLADGKWRCTECGLQPF